jgi:hypothetical protein
MSKKILNFMLRYYAIKQEACRRMIDAAHGAGLTVDHLVDCATLRDPESIQFLKTQIAEHGDDITLWLHPDERLLCEMQIDERQDFFGYYTAANKARLADAMTALYETVTGLRMEVAAYFYVDHAGLEALKKAAPFLNCVMAACFEEGIKVLHGHRYFDLEWNSQNEGGPWWPWIPRQGNSLIPAGPDEPKLDLVCIPHLTRNLMQSFDARNDFNSSQPMDAMRGKSVSAGNIDYFRRLFAENMRQAEFNDGFAYYQFFEEPHPLMKNAAHVFDEDPEECAAVFDQTVAFLGEEVRKGNVCHLSLRDFGAWYLKEFDHSTPPTFAHWRDLLHGSPKEYLWYCDAGMRVLLALNRGGAILDLRPYLAGIGRSTGTDTPNLWEMHHPFLIQNHHRYTTIAKGMLKCNGHCIDLSEREFEVKSVKPFDDGILINFQPVHIDFEGASFHLDCSTHLARGGRITTRRTVRNFSGDPERIEVCEYFKGTLGTNDLPVDLGGIQLWGESASGNVGLTYAHRGRQILVDSANAAKVVFPEQNFALVLRARDEHSSRLQIEEGNLFDTFYTASVITSAELRDGLCFESEIALEAPVGAIPAFDETDSQIRLGSGRVPSFKTAWGPSLQPLRCPECLQAEREVHLIEKDGRYRCQFCCFHGDTDAVHEKYARLRRY